MVSQFPASNDEPFVDPTESKTASLANSNGVVLRVVDFPAKTATLYHRTISLDFGILFEGEIDWYVHVPEKPYFRWTTTPISQAPPISAS
jgi:hypothetical protein